MILKTCLKESGVFIYRLLNVLCNTSDLIKLSNVKKQPTHSPDWSFGCAFGTRLCLAFKPDLRELFFIYSIMQKIRFKVWFLFQELECGVAFCVTCVCVLCTCGKYRVFPASLISLCLHVNGIRGENQLSLRNEWMKCTVNASGWQIAEIGQT